MHPFVIPFVKRFLVLAAVSAVLVLGISELAYRVQREDTSRGPETIELVIPAGTAERVAAGEAAPGIPEEMVFVLGDTLVVKNEDSTDHQLGPLWIPAGKSASLPLEQGDYAYSCSFQPTQYIGLTVREAVTWKSRLAALWYGGPPTLMFLLVYSFVVRPLQASSKTEGEEA